MRRGLEKVKAEWTMAACVFNMGILLRNFSRVRAVRA